MELLVQYRKSQYPNLMNILCKKSSYNIPIPLKDGRFLIYNSVSKAFVLLNASEYTLLNSEEIKVPSTCLVDDNDLYKRALENGFILPVEINELSIIESSYLQARNSDEVLMLTIAPTIGCNFACDYCFQEHDNKSGMSDAVQDKIVEFVAYVFNLRKDTFRQLHICWYGGEPLLKLKILKNLATRLIGFCKENNIKYSSQIITNGFLLNLDVARELFELGVSQCQITLDGPAQVHDSRRHLLSKRGTFDRIISNIVSYIDEVPIATSIRVNIDKRNMNNISSLIDYLAEMKLNGKKNLGIYFATVESTTSACRAVESFVLEKTDNARMMFKLYVKAVEMGLSSVVMPPTMLGLCTAAKKNGFIISPTGECHKCFDLITYSGYSIGTIFEYEKLLSFTDENKNARKWNEFSPFKNEICRDCLILPNCVSFCPLKFVHAESVNGKSLLPCPEWKFNIKSKLLFAAVKMGIITEFDYDKNAIVNTPGELSLSGRSYEIEDMIALTST